MRGKLATEPYYSMKILMRVAEMVQMQFEDGPLSPTAEFGEELRELGLKFLAAV